MTRPTKFALIPLPFLAAALAAAEPAPAPRETPEFGVPPGEVVLAVAHAAEAGEVTDWGVRAVNAPAAWKVTRGKGVGVAVLDTGCDLDHRDLKAAIKAAKDFTRSPIGPKDFARHGTHCGGTIGARENGWGLVGVAPECDLYVGKVLGDNGSGSVDGIAAGVRWAVAQGADVISMSLGGPGADSFIPPAFAEADAAGVILVVAAGNEGPREGTCGYPGRYPQAVTVAAVDSQKRTASFSSRCSAVFVAAPGVQIQSTVPGEGDGLFGLMSGTSMATPHVAGLAALWVAAHPEVPKKERPAKFREALKAACSDLPPPGRDTATGIGFPDAAKLVAGGSGPVDPPPAPGKVTFTLDELFSPDGRRKLFGLDPAKVDRVDVILKP